MKKSKSLKAALVPPITIFILELLTVILVLFIFRSVPDRLWAARWAALAFAALGILALSWLWPWRYKRWTFTAPLMAIFLLMFALPMALFRWSTDAPFDQLRWMSLSGPELHIYSSYFYYVLLAGTFIDVVIALICLRSEKKRPNS